MATLRCPVRDAVAYMLLPPPPPPPRRSRPAPSPPVRQRRWGRKNHNKMVLDDLDPMLEIDLTKHIFSNFCMDPPSRVHTKRREFSLVWIHPHTASRFVVYLEDGGGWD